MTTILRCRDFEVQCQQNFVSENVKIASKLFTDCYDINNQLTLHHPAARQFCRSTYTITDYNSAVLINIITGVSPPHFDFVMFLYYVLCQC
jgi:hypothetical protein